MYICVWVKQNMRMRFYQIYEPYKVWDVFRVGWTMNNEHGPWTMDTFHVFGYHAYHVLFALSALTALSPCMVFADFLCTETTRGGIVSMEVHENSRPFIWSLHVSWPTFRPYSAWTCLITSKDNKRIHTI